MKLNLPEHIVQCESDVPSNGPPSAFLPRTYRLRVAWNGPDAASEAATNGYHSNCSFFAPIFTGTGYRDVKQAVQ